MYRGTNPYSGVETVFEEGNALPLWSCDDMGYTWGKAGVTEKEVNGFLKKGRGRHLKDGSNHFLEDFV